MTPTSALCSELAEQLKARHGDLVLSYRQVLQELLFASRSEIRPRVLNDIATHEADVLIAYLCQQVASGNQRGKELCRLGLPQDSVLRLGQATRQFFIAHLPADSIAPALDLYDSYHNTVLQGFLQNHEEMILGEQERIRGALHRAVDRHTVEIQQVQAMAKKAEEANMFKSSFIAQISHDLRTPLGAILGMSEMLLEEVYGPLDTPKKDILKRIHSNAKSLSKAFTELLDQSRLEAGQLQLREEEFSPQELVKAVHLNCLPMALQKGLAMSLRVDPNLPPTLFGDGEKIGQILSNLVVNAIKYTDSGRVMVMAHTNGDASLILSVKDTGVGISEEAQKYIFEPYRQIDESKSRQVGGVGLGLAIVNQLVTAMGGAISVESRIGRGSTFTVMLPLRTVRSD